LQYETIPVLEAKLAKLTKQRDSNSHFFKQRIGPDQIADIVARWTGAR
jgi:ATP-dependent Clp protease ATP-binding subunit ClpA